MPGGGRLGTLRVDGQAVLTSAGGPLGVLELELGIMATSGQTVTVESPLFFESDVAMVLGFLADA